MYILRENNPYKAFIFPEGMGFNSYDELYETNIRGFELMENTAKALLSQFKEPLIYDLTIPSASKIKRLINIYLDAWEGKIVKPPEVNCCYPDYSKRNIEVDFGGKYSSVVERGLELCFNTKDKYDTMPLLVHLNRNPEIFGEENIPGKGTFYRFRDGMRDRLENNAKIYFDRGEFKAFEDIVGFVEPYIKNLDKSAKCAY